MSLAIGKEGQNVRLAARLTGWKIDIKSESQIRSMLEADLLNFSEGGEVFHAAQEETISASAQEIASQLFADLPASNDVEDEE